MDIDRTYQEKALFLLEEVKDLMLQILFTWAKANPELSYKQGMNEILGIFIFVAYAEIPVFPLNISSAAAEALSLLNCKEHLEADLYWCFSKTMDLGISDLFNPVVSQKHIKKPDVFTWKAERKQNNLVNSDQSQSESVSHILRRSHKIHHHLLKKIDPVIYKCLEKNQIEPQMYLQRWLRCMLTREFGLSDCLLLWDSVFANYSENPEKELEFLDYLCVAMLVFVRSFCKVYLVVQSEHFAILRRLFKFPPVEDVQVLVNMATRFKNPKTGKDSSGFVGGKVEEIVEKCQKDIMGNILMAEEQIARLIEEYLIYRKVYDEYKFQKAVDLVYEIKCQVAKDFFCEDNI